MGNNCMQAKSKQKWDLQPLPTCSHASEKTLTTKQSTPRKEPSRFFGSFRSLTSFRSSETRKNTYSEIPDLNIKMLQRMRTRLQKQRFLPYSTQPSQSTFFDWSHYIIDSLHSPEKSTNKMEKLLWVWKNVHLW